MILLKLVTLNIFLDITTQLWGFVYAITIKMVIKFFCLILCIFFEKRIIFKLSESHAPLNFNTIPDRMQSWKTYLCLSQFKILNSSSIINNVLFQNFYTTFLSQSHYIHEISENQSTEANFNQILKLMIDFINVLVSTCFSHILRFIIFTE